ncbi:hypothetical protein DFJ58DRAFT_326307 [Suillus subalutaceus]|uniref:uncharacterized protein n=1 Tax=Suillus subalutaceus TaxID=48586 RepID=UPI001B8635E8|nr:uncharacterized protein DFJ58DRAFT_326307 [Suillus subalutaceus]KAG1857740.1 hypothetical protein DFJ58DRAFT_326307 [Suillus subalutaceus]
MAPLGRSEILATDENQSTTSDSTSNKIYIIIVVVAVLLLMAARIYIVRRRRRSLRSSNPYDNSQAPENNIFSSSYQPSYRMHRLTPLPSVYHPDRRVNAADTDSAGRRTGGPDDPDWDGKDILPAYNKFDRPPKYDLGGVLPAQGYTPSAGNHPRNDTVMASTEAIPVVEDQSMASVRTGPSDGDDSALSAPRHEASS